MTRRTSVILDTDLLAEAERILGTTRTSQTIHLALTEIVRREKRRGLAALEMPSLTPESLEQSRRGHSEDAEDVG